MLPPLPVPHKYSKAPFFLACSARFELHFMTFSNFTVTYLIPLAVLALQFIVYFPLWSTAVLREYLSCTWTLRPFLSNISRRPGCLEILRLGPHLAELTLLQSWLYMGENIPNRIVISKLFSWTAVQNVHCIFTRSMYVIQHWTVLPSQPFIMLPW